MSDETNNLIINDQPDPRSLIEIVVSRLGGQIHALETYHGERLYRVHDWVYILSESQEKDRRNPWHELKHELLDHRTVRPFDFVTKEQVDPDNTRHDTDFCDEQTIYFITQYLPATETVKAVRQFLASAGVLVDNIRRNPELGHDTMREAYRMMGKDEVWINIRIDGIINRHKFTESLKEAVRITLEGKDYAVATDDLYIGLWKRTTKMLLTQMELPPKSNLRDHQSRLALLFEGIAEEICTAQLGMEKSVGWYTARAIIQETAAQIGKYVEETSIKLNRDIPTDIPLEAGYELPHIDGSGKKLDDLLTPIPRNNFLE